MVQNLNLSIKILFLWGMSVALIACSQYDNEFVGDDPEAEIIANALKPLQIENYLGNYENIHPKVLYFDEGWKGYKFWMAYTPFPLGKDAYENPCLAVSNDGINWITPPGVINPFAYPPEGGYNSDTHLVYDKENDRMELWWREFDRESAKDRLVRQVSSDGVHWEEKEETWGFLARNEFRLSPAVWIESGIYYLIYSDHYKLHIASSYGPETQWEWENISLLPIEWGELSAWHQDVIYDEANDRLEMVVCAYGPDGNSSTADLYYVELPRNLAATGYPYLILHRGAYTNDFDYISIYRSSLVKVKDEYYVYYSSIDKLKHRHMALTKGKDIMKLRGFGR